MYLHNNLLYQPGPFHTAEIYTLCCRGYSLTSLARNETTVWSPKLNRHLKGSCFAMNILFISSLQKEAKWSSHLFYLILGQVSPTESLLKPLHTRNKWESLIFRARAIDMITQALWEWCSVLYNNSFQLRLGSRSLFPFIIGFPLVYSWIDSNSVSDCSKRDFIFSHKVHPAVVLPFVFAGKVCKTFTEKGVKM